MWIPVWELGGDVCLAVLLQDGGDGVWISSHHIQTICQGYLYISVLGSRLKSFIKNVKSFLHQQKKNIQLQIRSNNLKENNWKKTHSVIYDLKTEIIMEVWFFNFFKIYIPPICLFFNIYFKAEINSHNFEKHLFKNFFSFNLIYCHRIFTILTFLKIVFKDR